MKVSTWSIDLVVALVILHLKIVAPITDCKRMVIGQKWVNPKECSWPAYSSGQWRYAWMYVWVHALVCLCVSASMCGCKRVCVNKCQCAVFGLEHAITPV